MYSDTLSDYLKDSYAILIQEYSSIAIHIVFEFAFITVRSRQTICTKDVITCTIISFPTQHVNKLANCKSTVAFSSSRR